ncbi:outer membrane protein assembly factor BamB [Curvibacter fontanus]
MILSRPLLLRAWRGAGALALTALLLACSSAPNRPEPAPLPPDPKLLGMRQVWSLEIDKVEFPLVLQVAGNTVGVASSAGQVSLLDGRTGEVQWRAEVGTPLNAGVGHDGRMAAVVTTENELVALQEGRELWRQRLNAPSYTAPLVAGARVFVLGADRSVSAYDGQSGRRLWHQTRSGEALVLRQPGVLIPVDDTLVVGLAGRLAGLNPLNGTPRWEVPIATPRGTNDVERLVDLVAGVARQGSVVCTRAFQAALGCVDAARGALVWSKPAAGASGLSGDASLLLGVEFDGTVVAWRPKDGERAWSTNQLRYRKLSSPLLLGPALVVGDDAGRLHFLARQDGALQTRIETDGTPIAATPVLVGSTVVVVTRAGRVLGLRPE